MVYGGGMNPDNVQSNDYVYSLQQQGEGGARGNNPNSVPWFDPPELNVACMIQQSPRTIISSALSGLKYIT